MKPWFISEALFDSSLIDLTLYAVLLSPCRRLISRYRVRLIVGYPELSLHPVNEVDDPFHHLRASPRHDERDLSAKDLRCTETRIGFRSAERRKEIVHGFSNRSSMELVVRLKSRLNGYGNLSK